MTTVTSAQANKVLQAALFVAANRNRSFVNMLTENAPKSAQADNGKRNVEQSSPHAPVVRVTDLTRQAGDEVDVDIFFKLNKRPTMGDKKLEGRGENLEQSTFGLKINQGRHMVNAGGRMSQKRTKHNLGKTARTLLGTYYNDLSDQICTVQMMGARGDMTADDIIVPLQDDPEFAEIMVNDVTPPTYGRQMYGGDATSLETLDSADLFTLDVVDNLSLYLSEMAHPLAPIPGKRLYRRMSLLASSWQPRHLDLARQGSARRMMPAQPSRMCSLNCQTGVASYCSATLLTP